jgi:hypothetical protein
MIATARMVYTQVLEGRQGADGRRNDVVGNQEKGTDNGKDLGTMPDARVNAAPVRIMAADCHVVHADQRSEQTHGRDQPERAIAGNRKG